MKIMSVIAATMVIATSVSGCASKTNETHDQSINIEKMNIGATAAVSGLYTYGHEVSVFSPCKVDKHYWAVASGADTIMQRLNNASLAKADAIGKPYQSVFTMLDIKKLPPAKEGFAEDYDGLIDVVAIKKIENSIPESCPDLNP
ncbi:hypothetical protein HPQ32_18260 [Photobacterium carnosum]|uniref:hypothetical protein n=1 Tax=Photobacterium carnosum TaxID=2023717 RepID=UPI001C91DEA7|nr:hypothetical protein [Photobacterium carnosum]MBY3790337.1 hypothetical protein [Photobacterium carnosum]MCD9496395.1 hypothetical protein [Photobacterium carnosum]MCD9535380.1 hypothetical protein [Photobacterium carnosum]